MVGQVRASCMGLLVGVEKEPVGLIFESLGRKCCWVVGDGL